MLSKDWPYLEKSGKDGSYNQNEQSGETKTIGHHALMTETVGIS